MTARRAPSVPDRRAERTPAAVVSVAGLSLPNNTTTTVTFDTVEHDPYGWLQSGQLIAPVDGLYLVTAEVKITTNVGSATRFLAQLLVTGDVKYREDRHAGHDDPGIVLAGHLLASAGDTLRLRTFHDSGATETADCRIGAHLVTLT